jgi:hypothetical protein
MIRHPLLLFGLLINLAVSAQFSKAERDSIYHASRADYLGMLSQLGIQQKEIRPGASGNPKDSNAANRLEDKVNHYTLPDPLQLKNGGRIKTVAAWWSKRRPEIVEDFDAEIYGRLPARIPLVKWEIVSVTDTLIGNYKAREKILKGVVDNRDYPQLSVEIELQVVTPANSTGQVPVVLEFGFFRPFGNMGAITPIGLGSPGEPSWKEQLLSRGWGYSIVFPNSIQADNGAGLRSGIIGLVNKGQPRKPDDWGALRAWAWGASRVIDYLETDKDVDAKRIGVEGISRYGKAAIVAMAYEPRISLGFIGSSGAGGTKILRRVFGEQVENLASTGAYHWFCGNFIKYASKRTADDLPVDAHELVALCAPRPVFISAGSPQVEGQWIDARGMFLGAVHAGPVYSLLGKKDLGTIDFPMIGMPLVNGELAFRQHAGGHSTGPNWSTWIAWACRYWGVGKYD